MADSRRCFIAILSTDDANITSGPLLSAARWANLFATSAMRTIHRPYRDDYVETSPCARTTHAASKGFTQIFGTRSPS